jgi:hypothetical protein
MTHLALSFSAANHFPKKALVSLKIIIYSSLVIKLIRIFQAGSFSEFFNSI